MKRSFAFFVISLLFFSIFAAETTDTSEEQSVFQQYQTFSWEAVPRARKYEVVVEDFKDGKWIKEISEKTRKTNVELLLNPGQKRISIISYNFLGRKASSSDWVEFIILSETQPYLYDDYLKKSSVWNSPILRISHLEGDSSGDNLESEDGDPENSFFVKGKNIFFEGTKFSLVPADRSMSGGKDYQSYVTGRRTSPLTVVRRDYERSGVVVAYNADDLFSGYYRIVAENPGGMSTGLDILVFADAEPVFDMSNFDFDNNFKTPCISISNVINNGGVLKICGTGFTFDTKFTLVPSNAGIPYPFSSSISRERIVLTVNSVESKSSASILEVAAKADTALLHSGYYRLVAESNSGRAEQLILFKDEENVDSLPIINSIAGSAGQKSEQVTFEVKGKSLSDSYVMTLVSSFNAETGNNTRIPLSIVDIKKQGKRAFVQGSKEKITPGIYALLLENEGSYKRIYLEIDKRYKVHIEQLPPERVAEIFFIPADYVSIEKEEVEFVPPSPDDLSYETLDFTVTSRFATVFPTLTFELELCDYAMIMSTASGGASGGVSLTGTKVMLDILRLKWFTWNIGVNAMVYYSQPAFSTAVHLTTPTRKFRPFVGVGANFHFGESYILADADNMIYNPFDVDLMLEAGVSLLDYFIFQYSFNFHNFSDYVRAKSVGDSIALNSLLSYHTFYIGATFPIRSMVYTKIPETSTLTITRAGIVSGTDYELQTDIKKIVFANGVKSIEHFEEMEILAEVVLPESLAKIGEKAFYNCENLKEISIPDGVVEIGDYAFAGCRSIKEIILPSSIRKISPTAFDGWGDNSLNQQIKVRWDADDETVRNLGGVEKLRCFAGSVAPTSEGTTVISSKPEIPISILDVEDIYVRNQKGGGKVEFESGNINYKGFKYKSIHFNGRKSDEDGSAAGIKTYSKSACDYLKSGDTLSFYMRASGEPLTLYIGDDRGKVIFSTVLQPCREVTKVVIPYKQLKLDPKSPAGSRIEDLDIGMFGIGVGEDNSTASFNAYFFGFEVTK